MDITREWRTWARKCKLDTSMIPRDEFERLMERYYTHPDALEREVLRGEWAAEWLHGPKDRLVYALGDPKVGLRRKKTGFSLDEFRAWEWFALEDAWNNGVKSSSTSWSVDGSQMLAVGTFDETRTPKRTGYVKLFRVEDQPVQVIRTWAVFWNKFTKGRELADDAIKKLGDYIKFGSWLGMAIEFDKAGYTKRVK